MNKQLFLYDTTLRDGAQYKGISFSLQDKLRITQMLDSFGMDYIEGGWPGSNPKDDAYFAEAKNLNLHHAKLVAFGSTRKPRIKVADDPQIQALLKAKTPVVALVSKFWSFHVDTVLRTDLQENLRMIDDSVQFFKSHGREVILDAEHFFDGYKADRSYALQCLQTAIDAGADNVTLCDTNGGSMPQEVYDIVATVKKHFPQLKLGIHCHNDCELAVANSLQSIHTGVELVQGTVNGYGERCGNANLIALIGSIALKNNFNQTFHLNTNVQLQTLSQLANKVSDIANIPLATNAAYVGENAFSHKGGIHVAAIEKASKTYEHIHPQLVGNQRNITISELSGKSNVQLQAKKLGLDVSRNFSEVLQSIKSLEKTGLTLENAPGSFEMLVRKHDRSYRPKFSVLNIQINTCDLNKPAEDNSELCTAAVKLSVNNKVSHVVADASGPVDALNLALKKALAEFYPQVKNMQLTDYKVSILNPEKASAATTRVWIQSCYRESCYKESRYKESCYKESRYKESCYKESRYKESGDKHHQWATIGCSDNIIKASTQALVDSYQLFLIKFKHSTKKYSKSEKEVIDHGST